MKKYALLCGSAPDGKIQKKIDAMYESLTESYKDSEIMIFPNGIDESALVYVMNNLCMSGVEQVFLYVCTVTPVADYEKTLWLGGNEIRKIIFEKSAALGEFVLARGNRASAEGDSICKSSYDLTRQNFSVQVVYGSDREFVDSSEYYYDAECAGLDWR